MSRSPGDNALQLGNSQQKKKTVKIEIILKKTLVARMEFAFQQIKFCI